MRALTHACRSARRRCSATGARQRAGGHRRTRQQADRRLAAQRGHREELTATLLEASSPRRGTGNPSGARARRLTQLGLPYAPGCGGQPSPGGFLSRQLAATDELEGFQREPPRGASFLHPTAVLFNGGVFKSELLARRTLETINGWLAAEGAPEARRLGGADLDLAVAARRRLLRRRRPGAHPRRHGTRLLRRDRIGDACHSGLRAAAAGAVPAPFGMEEGTEAAVSARDFGLVVGEQVSLRFFSSSVRRQDQVGTLLEGGNPTNSRSSTSSRPPCRPSRDASAR